MLALRATDAAGAATAAPDDGESDTDLTLVLIVGGILLIILIVALVADLFLDLANGAFCGGFAVVELAGRHLEQGAVVPDAEHHIFPRRPEIGETAANQVELGHRRGVRVGGPARVRARRPQRCATSAATTITWQACHVSGTRPACCTGTARPTA